MHNVSKRKVMVLRSGKKPYSRPRLARRGNLKNITAEWQCSSIDDRHSHTRGRGHCSHGNGNGYGHLP